MQKIAVIGPSADDVDACWATITDSRRSRWRRWKESQQQFSRARFALRWARPTRRNRWRSIPAEAFTPERHAPRAAGRVLRQRRFGRRSPKFQRVEARPDMQPGNRDPAAGFHRDGVFGALDGHAEAAGNGRLPAGAAWRWTGSSLRLFLDDKELAPEGTPGRGRPVLLPAHLEAGQSYRLRRGIPVAGGISASAQLGWIPPAEPLLAEAVDAVKNSDVTMAFVGLNPNLEGEEMPVQHPRFRRRRPHRPESAGAAGKAGGGGHRAPANRWWWC